MAAKRRRIEAGMKAKAALAAVLGLLFSLNDGFPEILEE